MCKLLVLLALVVCTSDPVLKDGAAGEKYLPNKVGTKWVYVDDGKEATRTVTASERKKGEVIVTLRIVDRQGKRDVEMKATDGGIFQLTGLAVKHPPSQLLKLPHKDGQKWTTYTSAWPFGESTYTATGPEKVKVPAGEYDAIKIQAVDPSRIGTDIVRTYWYAPGVGLVKSVQEVGDKTYTCELKSFIPGKE